jgi:hypothetical protein
MVRHNIMAAGACGGRPHGSQEIKNEQKEAARDKIYLQRHTLQ